MGNKLSEVIKRCLDKGICSDYMIEISKKYNFNLSEHGKFKIGDFVGFVSHDPRERLRMFRIKKITPCKTALIDIGICNHVESGNCQGKINGECFGYDIYRLFHIAKARELYRKQREEEGIELERNSNS